MNIGIVQEQDFHTEIIGFLLSYFSNYNYNIYIFFNYYHSTSSYIETYCKYYKLNIFFKRTSELINLKNKLNKVIFLTKPNNKSLFDIIENNKKILLIHCLYQYTNNIINICPCKGYRQSGLNIIEPFFKFNVQPKNILSKNILVLGNFNNKDINDLKNNSNMFNKFKFILVNRNIPTNINLENVKIYRNLATKQLLNMFVNDIDYALLLNKKKNIL